MYTYGKFLESKKNKEKKYSYGCLMLYYDNYLSNFLENNIDKKDIYTEDDLGFENSYFSFFSNTGYFN